MFLFQNFPRLFPLGYVKRKIAVGIDGSHIGSMR